jgi:hypothetical protein
MAFRVPNFYRIVIGDGKVVLSVLLGGKPDVASGLPGRFVAKLAKNLYKF